MTPGDDLRNDVVKVVPYDPTWVQKFEVEAVGVRRALGEFVAEVEHIGSTSVPGMWAKPILDILVGAKSAGEPCEGVIAGLESLGYEYQGEDRRRLGRYGFTKRQGTWCNLSIVLHNSRLWLDNLHVREYLASHPEEAARYSAIKRREAERHSDSPQDYQDAKRDYVDQLRVVARSWAEPTPRLQITSRDERHGSRFRQLEALQRRLE